jgi:hypothetical protein
MFYTAVKSFSVQFQNRQMAICFDHCGLELSGDLTNVSPKHLLDAHNLHHKYMHDLPLFAERHGRLQ